MAQKYKIFIKGGAVEIAENPAFSDLDEGLTKDIIKTLIEGHEGNLKYEVTKAEALMQSILKSLRLVVAAGGFVTNENGELLMIHRRGFWDLPKGKAEQGESIEETAVREVEEECAVGGLSIESEAFNTYHVYQEKGEWILKQSVWFAMNTHLQDLSPQTEEDIEMAVWVKRPIPQEIMDGAYPSIIEVLRHFNWEE